MNNPKNKGNESRLVSRDKQYTILYNGILLPKLSGEKKSCVNYSMSNSKKHKNTADVWKRGGGWGPPVALLIPGGQKCMSFSAAQPLKKKNLRIRNKAHKAPIATTMPL